jgi:hypothetical protein
MSGRPLHGEDEVDDELVEIVGTVFLLDEDPEEDPILGIDTDDEEFLIAEGDYNEGLRDLEGEVVNATGRVWVDDAGNNWILLSGYEIAD